MPICRRSIFILLTSATLLGCGTDPIRTSDAVQVHTDRILLGQYAQPGYDSVPITIKRDIGAHGIVCALRVFVAGQPVVDLKAGESVTLHLTTGYHVLGARSVGFLCIAGETEIELEASKDRPQTLRVGYTSAGTVIFSPTAF